MPISQQIGSSSLAKPGVCTSTTRPASPYQGQVIYETDTARTLVWNGSAWVYLSTSTANPVGLELVKTHTITGSPATSTISSAFNSSYDHYRIAITNVQITSGTAYLRVQFGSSSNHRWSLLYSPFNATFSNLNGTGQTTIQYMNGTTDNHSFTFDVFGPNIAKHTRLSPINYIDPGAAGVMVGVVEDTTQYTDFTLGCSASTMSSGTVTVYGYKK